MRRTSQQDVTIKWVVDALNSHSRKTLISSARAGCGKTTTLVEIAREVSSLLFTGEEGFFGAYNKDIAEEIKLKLDGIDVFYSSTLHSAGMRMWLASLGRCKRPKVNRFKVMNIVDEYIQAINPAEASRIETVIRQKPTIVAAVSMAKQWAIGYMCEINDMDMWRDMFSVHTLDSDLNESDSINEVIYVAIEILKKSTTQDRTVIDFDDMIYAPLIHNIKIQHYRLVMIDEGHDLNRARRSLAVKMCDPNKGVLIVVGDRKQAIYGWSGADARSLDTLKAECNADELPLTTTFRCPKKVVEVARQWVSDITALESNSEGIVEEISLSKFKTMELTNTDAILCRNTSPLVSLAYSLIHRGIGCRIEGRDIGQNLVQLALKWKVKTLPELLEQLEVYRTEQTARWTKKNKKYMIHIIEDRIDTLIALSNKLQDEHNTLVENLVSYLKNLFGDYETSDKNTKQPDVLTLSTIHKSKGREWNRVFLYKSKTLQPSKYAEQAWEKEQEENLMYVAVTRSKSELYFVD